MKRITVLAIALVALVAVAAVLLKSHAHEARRGPILPKVGTCISTTWTRTSATICVDVARRPRKRSKLST